MKLILEGTPAEMAQWLREMASGDALTAVGPVQTAARQRMVTPEEIDEQLPGCAMCERFGDDRRRCRRADCEYSEVNQRAIHGEVG